MSRSQSTHQHSPNLKEDSLRFPPLQSSPQKHPSRKGNHEQKLSSQFEPINENHETQRSLSRNNNSNGRSNHNASRNLSQDDLGPVLEGQKTQNRMSEQQIVNATCKIVYKTHLQQKAAKKAQLYQQELLDIYQKKKRIQETSNEKQRRNQEHEQELELKYFQAKNLKEENKQNLEATQRSIFEQRVKQADDLKEQSLRNQKQKDHQIQQYLQANKARSDAVKQMEYNAQQTINQFHQNRLSQSKSLYEKRINLEKTKYSLKNEQLQALENLQHSIDGGYSDAHTLQNDLQIALEDVQNLSPEEIEAKYPHLLQKPGQKTKRSKSISQQQQQQPYKKQPSGNSDQRYLYHDPSKQYSSPQHVSTRKVYYSDHKKSNLNTPQQQQSQQQNNSNRSPNAFNNSDLKISSSSNTGRKIDNLDSQSAKRKDVQSLQQTEDNNNSLPQINHDFSKFFHSIGIEKNKQRKILQSPYMSPSKNTIVKFLKSIEQEKRYKNSGSSKISEDQMSDQKNTSQLENKADTDDNHQQQQANTTDFSSQQKNQKKNHRSKSFASSSFIQQSSPYRASEVDSVS